MHPDRATQFILSTEDGHVTQADEKLTDARRVTITGAFRIRLA